MNFWIEELDKKSPLLGGPEMGKIPGFYFQWGTVIGFMVPRGGVDPTTKGL